MMAREVRLLVESAHVATKKAVGGFSRFWGVWGELADHPIPVHEFRTHVQDQLTEDTRRTG